MCMWSIGDVMRRSSVESAVFGVLLGVLMVVTGAKQHTSASLHDDQLSWANATTSRPEHTNKAHLKKAFESSLIHIFGMKQPPKTSELSKSRVPQYMLDLYRDNFVEGHSYTWSSDSTARRKRHSYSSATTIRSFTNPEWMFDNTSSLGRDGFVKLYFDVSSIPDNEATTGAELRVHFKLADETFRHSQRYRITVYQMLAPRSDIDTPLRQLDTRVGRTSTEGAGGWESFDVTQAVKHWRSHLNYGLRVECTMIHTNSSVRVPLTISAQPILVVYGDEGRQSRQSTSRRVKSRPITTEPPLTHNHRKRSPRKSKKRESRCHRLPLYVDFSEVGWNDWIVAPAGYQAYYCNGSCPFYLPEHLNSTNHAVVQTLVHSVNPTVPHPCCVPTELSPISMLYIDSSEKVVIKNYQDMVVEACGCR